MSKTNTTPERALAIARLTKAGWWLHMHGARTPSAIRRRIADGTLGQVPFCGGSNAQEIGRAFGDLDGELLAVLTPGDAPPSAWAEFEAGGANQSQRAAFASGERVPPGYYKGIPTDRPKAERDRLARERMERARNGRSATGASPATVPTEDLIPSIPSHYYVGVPFDLTRAERDRRAWLKWYKRTPMDAMRHPCSAEYAGDLEVTSPPPRDVTVTADQEEDGTLTVRTVVNGATESIERVSTRRERRASGGRRSVRAAEAGKAAEAVALGAAKRLSAAELAYAEAQATLSDRRRALERTAEWAFVQAAEDALRAAAAERDAAYAALIGPMP